MGEVENEILDVSSLATTAVPNTKIDEVVNKIPVSKLIKKVDYNPKKTDIEEKYFTTSDNNKFMNDIRNTKIKQKKLVSESNISNLVKILI